MSISRNVADSLNQYIIESGEGDGDLGYPSLLIPEGAYKGWVPKDIYSKTLRRVRLPFLRLLSFPVGGTSIGTLPQQLTDFSAEGNYLTKLPKCFAECCKLTRLSLGYNHFTEIPYPVYGLVNLEDLNLEHNCLEYVDKTIGQLRSLRILNLSGNMLRELPPELKQCRKIQRLYLSGKFYPRGKIQQFPECICGLNDLVFLDLSWQQVRNIPASFGNLRKLEELNLKWNQLQEVSQEMKKCTKLLRIDLSGALRLLSAIPAALFYLEDLHTLNLSDNFFTDVPSEVCGLIKLRHLVVQRNSLLRLSPDLYKLRYLQHLELGENFLEALPEGLRSLKRLEYLGLCQNRLTDLPDEICFLGQLRYLGLGHNKITQLPENIYHLQSLTTLDVNDNELREVPLLMDRLDLLASNDGLHLHNNPLRSPFLEISEQGTSQLFEYLKGIRLKEAHHRWKMIMIGAAKAGKTSLRQALMLGRSKLTADNERTWVMERHLWEPESRLRVQIMDFGGHHIYQAAHHMFLSPDALHVLVFDLTKYSTEAYEDLIGHWLEAIMDRAAGAKIVMVGTHCDLCTKEDVQEKREDILRLVRRNEARKRNDIEREIRKIRTELDKPEAREVSGGIPEIGVGRLQEKLNRLEKMLNSRSEVPDEIHVVSCADNLYGVSDFCSFLVGRLKSVPASGLPDHWFTFLEQIQQVPDRVISFEQAMGYFKSVMAENHQSMMGMGGSPERSLEMVLKYLHSTGEIVWYSDNTELRTTVFHRPEALIDMLRAVFRHDFDEVVQFSPDLGESLELRRDRFDRMKQNFLQRGLLTRELLRFLLVLFRLTEDASDSFLDLTLSLMLKFSLCFKLQKSQATALVSPSEVVQFPWFFSSEKPQDFEGKWPQLRPPRMFELVMEINFSGPAPPNFFEKLSVKLHNFLYDTSRINWQNGVLAQRNTSTLLVERERRNQGTTVVVSARTESASDLTELWWLVMNVRLAAMHLFKDWPLLKVELELVCMHCVLKGLDTPTRYPGEVFEHVIPKGEYTLKCCDRFPDDHVPTCFVFPLEEKEYQDNHDLYIKAAADCMQSSMDEVDASLGPSCNAERMLYGRGLSVLSRRLTDEWTAVLMRLGVPYERLHQLELSYPTNFPERVLLGLTEWRDGTEGSPEEKVEALFTVLSEEDISQNELVEDLREQFGL
ncbi:malignant fibrous histiocytoma-amplified sequence 1 [Plakobranchus ocellatus]|uniref:Malignant fibrous histiocytoma-amplified sequence 1 n=1 Tax=Plakobranchus ocellatus TaxID=259542 RepID=A0AAV4AXF8_9GAST|nr:malignant fibrous histiocytoma-amplified sequence 1 [Plakobranchus ocellatus]